MIFTRPYDSLVFAVVQDGDIPALVAVLESGNASIHDVDPYGLGLLYVRPLAFGLEGSNVLLIRSSSTLLTTAGKAMVLKKPWKCAPGWFPLE